MKVHFSSKSDEWSTPLGFSDKYGPFDLDPAATSENAQAPKFYTKTENGLLQDWGGILWVNPSRCDCGVEPIMVDSSHENLYQVPQEVRSYAHKLRKETPGWEGLPFVLVSSMHKTTCEAEATSPEGRSPSKGKAFGGKEKVFQQSQREGEKAPTVFHQQPQEKVPPRETTVGLDGTTLEGLPSHVESPVRLLSKDWREPNSGSLHTTYPPGLSRNSDMEHGSCLHELQHLKAKEPSQGVERLSIALCKDCGQVGLIRAKRIFLNPPYGRGIGLWMAKAVREAHQGATVVCLLPARTDTRWWHDYVIPYGEIEFLKGRLKFGGNKNSAPFPSAVVIFDCKKITQSL